MNCIINLCICMCFIFYYIIIKHQSDTQLSTDLSWNHLFRTTRLASFPDYLLIHLKKFTVKEDWTPIKLDVAVEMPDMLDLSCLRGNGLQPNEELLPETASTDMPPPAYDSLMLEQLIEMGFSPEACKRALYFTENHSLQAAINWAMEHIADSDFAEPFIPPGIDVKSGKEDRHCAWYILALIELYYYNCL